MRAFLASALLLAAACGKKQLAASEEPPKTGFFAVLDTEAGAVVVRLFDEESPRAVAAFAHAAERGLYDGAAFLRLLPGVLIQAAGPRGGDSGAYLEESSPRKRFRKAGVLALTSPPSGGQFFLTLSPAPWLDGRHVAIGETVSGLEAALALSRLRGRVPVVRKLTVERRG